MCQFELQNGLGATHINAECNSTSDRYWFIIYGTEVVPVRLCALRSLCY